MPGKFTVQSSAANRRRLLLLHAAPFCFKPGKHTVPSVKHSCQATNQVMLLPLLMSPQVTCNVHGVASVFLDIGRSKANKPPAGMHRFTKVRR
jgi:hypothetical protein